METIFKPPPAVSFTTSNTADVWRKWEQQFRFFHEAAELSKKSAKTQVAILLHCAGQEAQDIHKSFEFAGTDQDSGENWEHVLKKFRDYCEPRKNECFERHKFWQRNQKEGESVDQWVTELRLLLDTCEYNCRACKCEHVQQKILRDKIVFSIADSRVKERLLRELGLTLDKTLDICRAAEASKQQMQAMASASHVTPANKDVYAVSGNKDPKKSQQQKGKGPKKWNKQRKAGQGNKSTNLVQNCNYCGGTHEPRKCPAYGVTCNKCQGRNHYSTVCKGGGYRKQLYQQKQQVYQIDEQDSAQLPQGNYLFVGSVETNAVTNDKWQTQLNICGNSVWFKLDTGAQANILPQSEYAKMDPKPPLYETDTILSAFGDSKIKPCGTTVLPCNTEKGGTSDLLFYVTDQGVPILGQQACETLQFVKRIDMCAPNSPLTKDKLKREYSDVFTGIGCYEREYDIKLKAESKGVIQSPRKVPFALQPKLKKALDKLTEQNIIADVDTPTEWVNSLVIAEKKNGSLRLCLDPKPLNDAIMRETHAIPTPADVQATLSGKKVFSVADMRDAYWHVKLSEESSYLCTFNTPWGRKRFLRMPFGISSASEVMQKRNEEIFGDIPDVHVINDDIIIAAVDEISHDNTFIKVLNRAREKGAKFSLDKLQFKVSQVTYMGNIVTADGLKPDTRKVDAIVNMPKPSDVASLRRLLGMVKYLSQYIPNESSITAPLRDLLKQGVEWQWQPEHDEALEKIKQVLSSNPVLQFYDVNEPVAIQVDASQSALGACLLQHDLPVAYASRTMTSAECNYSQIEKELLAICYGCEKFHQYIYGKQHIQIYSDHKPLEIILKKPMHKASPRLQRLMIRLQAYDLDVTYVKGQYMYIADCLSRAPVASDSDDSDLEDEMIMAIHSLVEDLPVSASKFSEVQKATEQDSDLQLVIQCIMKGWPKCRRSIPVSIRAYWNIRDELHVIQGVVMFGNRMVIPSSLRQQMLSLIHESHMGGDKCKARARTIFYWPGMNDNIEEIVSKCQICLKYRPSQAKEPMISHDIPEGRFLKVGLDIMTLKGKDYLVAVDYYSKFPELSLLSDKTAKTVVAHTKSICARHGIPEEIVSDNMPFNSHEFREFAQQWGIKLTTSSPGYAQSNGQAERFVQTLKNLLKKADDNGRDPYIALLEYRNTPISGLNPPYSPSQLLYSRLLRSKMPVLSSVLEPRVVHAHDMLKARQFQQKKYYDTKARNVPYSVLKPGDVVRVQRGKVWEPACVTDVHTQPRSYIVQNEHGHIRRNRRQIIKTNEQMPLFLTPSLQDDNLPDPGSTPQMSPPISSPVSPPMSSQVSQPMSLPDQQVTMTVPQDPGQDSVVRKTMSGRVIKPPKRYEDYM